MKHMETPLVSICIPTYKREYIMRELLNSIYSQDVDHKVFDVCITDNSDTDETKEMLEKEFSDIDNLHYKKVTCKGFLNSIEALKYGDGDFLKLHNDYSIFKEGSLQKMIGLVQKCKKDKPVIFFSMKELHLKKDVHQFKTFNDFMDCIHYYATWSTSFTIWKEDFNRLLGENIEIDHMYPHTSLLFALTDKTKYVVDDFAYVNNISPKKKGGYNLPDNFVRIFLTMVKNDLLSEGHITEGVYRKIEKGIIKYTAHWYCAVKYNPDKYTFSFENCRQIIKNQCGTKQVFVYHMLVILYSGKQELRKLRRFVKWVLRRS